MRLVRLSLSAALGAALAFPQAPPAPAEEDEQPTLEVTRLELLDGPAGYAIPDDSLFFPGEKIYLAFNIKGYKFDDDYRMRVSYKVTTEGPSGNPFQLAEGGEFAEELAPQDENWEPLVRFTAAVPQHAESGPYKIRIEVTDEMARKTITRELAVTVEGEDIEISDKLSIRNFGFSRTEGGTRLSEPSFRSGDTVWASFYVTGFKTREDNTFELESDLEVFDPKGKKLYAFKPVEERGSPFYPRLWLPAHFSLELEKAIPSGRYVVALNVRDQIGETTLTLREEFRVR